MNFAQNILIGLITLYRWTLSPLKNVLFGPHAGCRYTPSCSEYALEAVRRYGAARGSWLATKRLCRCHPWSDCGHDPVPPKTKAKGVQDVQPEAIFLRKPVSPIR